MMTRLVLLLMLALFIGTGKVEAQKVATKSPLKFQSTVHDFGKIQETDGLVKCDFVFTNISNKPFLIRTVTVTCGCTTPSFSAKPILPGKEGVITVLFDPTGRMGKFRKAIRVIGTEPEQVILLYVQGQVIPRPYSLEDDFPIKITQEIWTTSQAISAGYLPRGTKKQLTIGVFNNSDVGIPLKINPAGPPKEYLNVQISPRILPPHGRGEIAIIYDLINHPFWGVSVDLFQLTIQGEAYPISTHAIAIENFAKNPDFLRENPPKATFTAQLHHFGNVAKNSINTYSFEIRNSGKAPLIIRNIQANNPLITFSMPQRVIQPEESEKLTLTLRSGDTLGRISSSVTIILNDPSRPMRELNLIANVQEEN